MKSGRKPTLTFSEQVKLRTIQAVFGENSPEVEQFWEQARVSAKLRRNIRRGKNVAPVPRKYNTYADATCPNIGRGGKMIYGVRYCDGAMMRFFSTEEQAREFIAHQEYSPTCYHVEALSEVDFANFVLTCFHNVDAVLKAHRLGGMG